jgi:hypothetical protein
MKVYKEAKHESTFLAITAINQPYTTLLKSSRKAYQSKNHETLTLRKFTKLAVIIESP